jgi:retron-type reverse transcriptase
MLLPLICAGLPISRTQHGFAAGRSTTTALLPLVTMVAHGFNQNKPPSHTAAAILDISKAFDAVDLTLLIQKISGSTLQPNLICWLATYLRGRIASCIFQSAKSPLMIIHSGTPQGGVLSPDLYNYYVSDFPEVAALTESYADDIDVAESSPDIQTLHCTHR